MKTIIIVAVVITLAIILFFTFFGFTNIAGQSMEPTINSGQTAIVRNFLTSKSPQRGDIVIFWKGANDSISRVIGMPHDSVKIDGGHVYLKTSGQTYRMEEPYVSAQGITKSDRDGEWIELKENDFFVMPDSRTQMLIIQNQLIDRVKLKSVVAKIL